MRTIVKITLWAGLGLLALDFVIWGTGNWPKPVDPLANLTEQQRKDLEWRTKQDNFRRALEFSVKQTCYPDCN